MACVRWFSAMTCRPRGPAMAVKLGDDGRASGMRKQDMVPAIHKNRSIQVYINSFF